MNKHLEKLKDLIEYLTRIDYVTPTLRQEVKELLIKAYQDSDGLINSIQKEIDELEKALDDMYDYL